MVLKEKGDMHLKEKQYKEAIQTYTDVLEWGGVTWMAFPDLMTDILCKRAECYIKLVSSDARVT